MCPLSGLGQEATSTIVKQGSFSLDLSLTPSVAFRVSVLFSVSSSGPAALASEGDYAAGQGFILLDDVACVGTELTLLDCPHSNWGQHDCSHAEDVGVRCSPESNTVMDGSLGNSPCFCPEQWESFTFWSVPL